MQSSTRLCLLLLVVVCAFSLCSAVSQLEALAALFGVPPTPDINGNSLFDEEHRDVVVDSMEIEANVIVHAEAEIAKLRELGIDKIEKAVVLDMGCGPGFFASKLLQAFPNIEKLVCADADPAFIEYAVSHVITQLPEKLKAKFVVETTSIEEKKLGEGTFDVVIARRLYQYVRKHLSGTYASSQLMWYLKPGGRIVLLDTDSFVADALEPALENYNPLKEQSEQHFSTSKSYHRETTSGRYLLKDLQPYFKNVTFDAITTIIDGDKKLYLPGLLNMFSYELLAKSDLAYMEHFTAAADEIRDWIAHADSFGMSITFIASGTKPYPYVPPQIKPKVRKAIKKDEL